MDASTDKKWFVYVGENHQGPISLDEIDQMMSQGLVNNESFVWAEGMPDWIQMTQVADFEPLLSKHSAGVEAPPAAPTEVLDLSESPELSASPELSGMPELPEPALPELSAGGAASDISIDGDALAIPDAPISTETEEAEPILPAHLRKNLEPEVEPELETLPEPEIPSEAKRADSRPIAEQMKMRPEFLQRTLRIAVPVMVVAGLGSAYYQGKLDPILESKGFKATIQTASDILQPLLLKGVEKLPALGRFISPIPALEDVEPADYERLKAAAMANLQKSGAKVAIAGSSTDPFSPIFYIASNLPDGAVFELSVVGIPDTLLNQLGFSNHQQVVILNKLGRSKKVQFPDGKMVPRGQYIIGTHESENQPSEIKAMISAAPSPTERIPANMPRSSKIFDEQSYFLGGKKDQIYTARLKEFHDKLMEKAKKELADLSQFTGTLETQLNDTTATYEGLRKGKLTPGKRQQWQAFDKKWATLSEQLKATFSIWTPEMLQTEFFYGTLFAMLQQTNGDIERVHLYQQQYVTRSANPKSLSDPSFDIQLGEAQARATQALSALKAKLEQAQQLPPTPNGMPQREGL